MSENLYNKILGIREDLVSPNHYELLGLALFEDNPRKVHRAGLRCLRRLKDWQLHPDPKTARAVQEIMNQVGLACTVLELSDKKDAYDHQLAVALGMVPPVVRPTKKMPRAVQPEVIGDIRIIGLDERKAIHSKKSVVGAKANLFELQKHLKFCPHCNARLSELAQVCIDCGYSFTLDKVLKTSLGTRVMERLAGGVRLGGKVVFRLVLLLLVVGIGYGGYYFYKEYGLDYLNYKFEIANGDIETAVRHEVRDSALWKTCSGLAERAGHDRPFFVFALKSVDGKKQYEVTYGSGKKVLYSVETSSEVTVDSVKEQTSLASLDVLGYLLKQKPEAMTQVAENFNLMSANDKQNILSFLRKEPEPLPLEIILSGVNIMVSREKDPKILAELTGFKELVEKKIEINARAEKLRAAGKSRQDFLSCFKFLSGGNAAEKAAALIALMRYPLKSSSKKQLDLLEVVIQSEKRSLEARCLAAWMLAGYVGSEYHSQAYGILERMRSRAPDKMRNYIKLASQMYLFKLTDEGFLVPDTGVILVPVLVGNMGSPVLLDNPFMISRHEISGQQYAKFSGITGIDKDSKLKPAVMVSWYDAALFCRRLNEFASAKKILDSGWELRLPTEHEFMSGRNALGAGSLMGGDAAPGELMREWCLDYVKLNKQGLPEPNEPDKINLQGKANLVLGHHSHGKSMMSAWYPWHTAPDLGFRVVIAPAVKLKSDYLDKKDGASVSASGAPEMGLYVLDQAFKLNNDVSLDILMERGFAWPAPNGALDVVQKRDGRTYKASGTQIFRIPNLGRTQIIWTGGRSFQWKALFKFNNGQETVRSGIGLKTYAFDIVLPDSEKYIVMQLTGEVDTVYTDQVEYKQLVGNARSLSLDKPKFIPDFDYITELAGLAEKAVTGDNSGKAWCLLTNVITFGQDISQWQRLLKNLPPPDLKNGPDAGAAKIAMAQFTGNVKAGLSTLKQKVDLKHSQLEAAILTDRDVVGQGLFMMSGSEAAPNEIFIFIAPNKLTLEDIIGIYGPPVSEYVGPGKCRYLFYGRIFFCLPPGAKVPFVVRFNLANPEDGIVVREIKK